MPKNHYRQRLDALFTDLERLAADPNYASPSVRRKLDALAARLHRLEKQITESEKKADLEPVAPAAPLVDPGVRPAAPPILYEKEKVGYAFSGNALHALQDAPPTVANPDKAIVAPLTSSGQTIGKMQVESPANQAWTSEETNLVESIAQQASQQIQNLRLLAATERARAEAEAATRRFMHENWDSYLDAIHHNERVGYAYDQTSVTPYADPSLTKEGIRKSVKVMDEHVGDLFVKSDPSRPLTEQDEAMIATIAQQVAQQVENIRLLADATRARAEAEEATRRLTRENWDSYAAQKGEAFSGFAYDMNQVTPIKETQLPQDVSFAQPLKVRGEIIGQLAMAGVKDLTPEAAELAVAVAERASVHLETLRLAEELQKRAAELQTVAKVSTTASTVLNPDELLQSVVDLAKKSFGVYHTHIYLANESWNTLLLAAGAGETGRQMVSDGHAIPMDTENSIVARAARERKASIVNSVRTDPGFLPNPLLPNTRSEIAVPMIAGDKVLGVFDVQSEVENGFTEEDANIYTTLSSQVAIALQNARLYVEQAAIVAQLRELDRLKSSFLANMSHELRTPLNSILGFTDVMIEELDGPLTENMNNDLQLIQKNGQHLLHLINDVLDMAKIEAGRMNLNPEKFCFYEILEEVTSITSPLASEKALSLYLDRDSDQEVEIFADRTRIRQVMLNLVNNAMKFTEKGKISLRVEHVDENILVTVRDTGAGIPPDKLDAIFQEFTQVDSSSTRKAGGTGLGLPISRRLIEMHGGRLWAESTGIPGEGSTFFVELPLEARFSDEIEIQEK